VGLSSSIARSPVFRHWRMQTLTALEIPEAISGLSRKRLLLHVGLIVG
jgi:hypothetical protein